jgi:hypothetical protein
MADESTVPPAVAEKMLEERTSIVYPETVKRPPAEKAEQKIDDKAMAEVYPRD